MIKYTPNSLNVRTQDIALLNSEIKMRPQAIHELILKKCCVYIPDNSTIVSEVLKDLHTQIDAMSDLKMNFGDLLSS
jgi:hypothetical protein